MRRTGGGGERVQASGMPWRTARAVGDVGEDLAAEYLVRAGYRILERNWRCPHGEVDIIAYDPAGGWLVFCEVKTRRSAAFGTPVEAVTPAKAARLRRLAIAWVEEQVGSRSGRVRIDVIGVMLAADPQESVIQHLKAVV